MDAKRHGYQHGYRDGLRQGRADMSRNMRYNYESDDYRRGDYRYQDYLGSHQDFQKGCRDGFKAGYDDGYYGKPIRSDVYGLDDRYNPDVRREEDPDRYPSAGYTDVAFDSGYRDGLKAGQNDYREHKEFKPEKHDSYEDADHGYHSRHGNKNAIKNTSKYRKANEARERLPKPHPPRRRSTPRSKLRQRDGALCCCCCCCCCYCRARS